MTNVVNDNQNFNKSHYLGTLGSVQLRKKIILFTQDVTFPNDVEQVLVTAVGGGKGGGGGAPGRAYSGATAGGGGAGGSGTAIRTALAKITGPVVKCEIGGGGSGGAGGQQLPGPVSIPGAAGAAGQNTKFIPYTPGGTSLTFYGAYSGGAGAPVSNTGAAGITINPQDNFSPDMQSSAGSGGNAGVSGSNGGKIRGINGGTGGIANEGGGGGAGGGGRDVGANGGMGGDILPLTNMNRWGALTTNGSAYYLLTTGFGSTVWAVARTNGNRNIFAGDFLTYNAGPRVRIISLNSTTGNVDATWSGVTGIGFNNSVRALAVQADGKVLVGGMFTAFNGTFRNRIVRLNYADGTLDNTLSIGTGLNGTVVNAVAVQADGAILAGGDFTLYNGVARNKIVRISTLGANDAGFAIGTGFNVGAVNAIAVQPLDQKIIVGGTFTQYQGLTNKNRIIRLNTNGSIDGSFDTSAAPVANSGFNGQVTCIAIQADGKILVGGDFTTYKGIAASRIIRLNSDGTRDNTFVMGTGFNVLVRSIQILSTGAIIVGGDFTLYNGTGVQRLCRVESNGSIVVPPAAGYFPTAITNNSVCAISSDLDFAGSPSGNFFIGGSFTTASALESIQGFAGDAGGYGAGGGGGGGGAYLASFPAPGGRGGNGGNGYMILSYFSKFE